MSSNQDLLNAAAQRYLYLAQKFRSMAPSEPDFHVFHGPVVFTTRSRMTELKRAVIMSGEWFVIADQKAYCDAYVQTPLPPLSAYLIQWRANATIDLLCEFPVHLALPNAFLLGGCPNYGHWTFDYLPRLSLYGGDEPLLVNRLTTFQKQALSFLGISFEQLIELEYPGAYVVDELHYASTGSSMWTPPLTFQPWIVEWLRHSFEPLFSHGRPRRKLFISRAEHPDSYSRRLLNGPEIIAIAERHGFEIIQNEKLSFDEQVRTYSEAATIVGPIGSGFSNMVFSPKGTKIIELIGPHMNQIDIAGFRGLAAILEHDYRRLAGHSDENAHLEKGHAGHETYTIDPDAFTLSLQA
jgi:hypothetical protein